MMPSNPYLRTAASSLKAQTSRKLRVRIGCTMEEMVRRQRSCWQRLVLMGAVAFRPVATALVFLLTMVWSYQLHSLRLLPPRAAMRWGRLRIRKQTRPRHQRSTHHQTGIGHSCTRFWPKYTSPTRLRNPPAPSE